RVVAYDIVPAIHEKAGKRILVIERVFRAHPEVVVRNGPSEQQAARIVPVVLGFDNLAAGWGHELADIHLQTLADRRQIGEVRLFKVLIKTKSSLGFGTIDGVDRLSKTKRHMIATAAVGGFRRLVD